MSSVSDNIAKVIVDNNGVYPGDPQAYAVFKIKNHYFGHVHPVVAYTRDDYERYVNDGHKVVEIMWSKEPIELR